MPTKLYLDNQFQGKVTSKEEIDSIFNGFSNGLRGKKEITIDLQKVTFISVYFLERLEQFVLRAKDLNVKVEIRNVGPSIYKVFQVARAKAVLDLVL